VHEQVLGIDQPYGLVLSLGKFNKT